MVIENINLCKYMSIVTSKADELNDYIIHELKRSCTIVEAEGGFTHDQKKVVMVACKRSQAIQLRRYARSIDDKAFMFITNTSEIIGKGFRGV